MDARTIAIVAITVITVLAALAFYYRGRSTRLKTEADRAFMQVREVRRESEEDIRITELAWRCRDAIYEDLVASLQPTLKNDLSIEPELETVEPVRTVVFHCVYRGSTKPEQLKKLIGEKVKEFLQDNPRPVFKVKFRFEEAR